MNLFSRLKPFPLSLAIHLTLALLIGVATLNFWRKKKPEPIEISIYSEVVQARLSSPVVPKAIVEKPPEKPTTAPRKVFGVSRKALTGSADGDVAVKQGNTVATAEDQLELRPDDEDSLPIPVADYLISDEPVIISEPKKRERTEEARRYGYAGQARMKILIDAEGNVRDVRMVNSLKYGLDQKAMELVKLVKFSPAKVDGRPVAVSRDFTVTFRATD